jgi:hypothetical protein
MVPSIGRYAAEQAVSEKNIALEIKPVNEIVTWKQTCHRVRFAHNFGVCPFYFRNPSNLSELSFC